jgi:glycosyltransferase involved in cell wall biosynthesis
VTSPPRVTIGVPVYNGERHLAKALDSLLAQDTTDFEVIISDNASTDGTAAICQHYVERDPRVSYVRNERNLGAAANYNRLLHLATTPYFKWASADDVCEPQLLTRCLEVLEGRPEVVLAYPKTVLIDEDDKVLRKHEDRLHMPFPAPAERLRHFATRRWLCNACFGVIRTDVLRRTALVRPYVSSDIALLAELALAGQFHEVPERLFRRRVAASSCGLGSLSTSEVAAWFDPQRGRPRVPPLIRVFADVEKTILTSRLRPAERLTTAHAFGLAWTKRRLGVRLWRLRMAIQHKALPMIGDKRLAEG